ncbi:MAG: hypothetical protein AMXMBFR23_00680 [Chloroflexota bacterium]
MPLLPFALRRRPPPEALAWVAREVGGGVRVSSVERLRAGTSSAVHLVRLRDRHGRPLAVVLRRFVRADWLAEEPDAAAREAHVLRAVEASALRAPRLIAVDPDGAACDVPAVLMSRLPGRIDLAPRNVEAYVDAAVTPLLALHAIGPVAGVPSYYPYVLGRTQEWRPPRWAHRPRLWRAAACVLHQPWPEAEPVLIHRDYHPGNLLWSRGRLSGVTDWVNASNGPPAMDVAHMRWNLAQLFGIDAAEAFRQAYESATGRPHHPYWDVLGALDGGDPVAAQWQDAGRLDLTEALLIERREAYLDGLMKRLG